jgi:two-component system, chemotaxis family, protein-glutamate methylesterase/glutaminase
MLTPPNPKALRVLIIDDSAFMRASLRHIVGHTPGFTVVGEANDGLAGVEAIRNLRPDVVTLDLDMPGLDGIGVLKRVRPPPGGAPVVIMVSAFTTQGAALTLSALSAGAIDFVPKASEHFKTDLAQVGELLRSKLAVAAAILTGRDRPPPKPRPAESAAPTVGGPAARPCAPASPPVSDGRVAVAAQTAPPQLRNVTVVGAPDLVVVAASTGGPQTLPNFLRPLCPFSAPIVIAQHIPAVFSRSLADSLASTLGVAVVEAEDGKELTANTVYLLPGGRNGEVARVRPNVFALRLLDGGSAVYRPNADILFRSAALTARRPVGVILTGMGSDGCDGARALAQRGAPVLVQDPATAVIWGMPRSAIEAGLASEVAEPAALGRRLAAMAGREG